MSTIDFSTKLLKIRSWTILRLPENASVKLPSRGMTMVSGTINGASFKALLEPDGRYAPGQKPSHWFAPPKKLLEDARAAAGNTVQVSLEPTKEWIEPETGTVYKVPTRTIDSWRTDGKWALKKEKFVAIAQKNNFTNSI